MPVVCVGIGSNLGDRRHNLRFAVKKIREMAESVVCVSSVYESDAWGYCSDNPFLNIVAEFESEAEPESLLSAFQEIEKEAGSGSHRDSSGNYIDRILDIDIIYIGDRIIDTGRLTVPHPRMSERDFVLVPLSELSPGWIHPVSRITVSRMLEELKSHIGQ